MKKSRFLWIFALAAVGWADGPGRDPVLQHSDLIDRFYQQRKQQPFWFVGGDAGGQDRRRLLQWIDSAAWFGLDSTRYGVADLRRAEAEVAEAAGASTIAHADLMVADRRFTDAALSLAFDLWRGAVDSTRSYDGVSPKYQQHDDSVILRGLHATAATGVDAWLRRLRPPGPGYDTVLAALRLSIDSGNARHTAQLAATLNTFRFIQHFGFDRFVVVNIPSAALRYYVADTLVLRMRVVAGQTAKRTPRFAAWCNGLVLYPYWNIPRRIAIKEMLPLFRKAPAATALLDIQVLDAKGRRLDPASINWKDVPAANFPYTLRQAPGCENALGVLKFELTDPFDVYMHDTNFKRAFGSNYRYLSHGCIRLEKAAQLGDLLLDHHLDTAFLAACLRDQQPKSIPLTKPLPVFVVYLTVLPDMAGRLSWYKDIYHLMH